MLDVFYENPQIVNVHSAAIHIEHKMSLKQRQAWFYLVYKAFPYLETQDMFQVSLAELKEAIGYKSSFNNQYLKELLKDLASVMVEWNIFEKDREYEWGVSSLLADCRITQNSGICEYSFSPGLKKRFFNPGMYAKLNLLISKRFNSKHSLALYCLALDYLNVKTNYSEKNLTVEQIRKYLGLEEGQYDTIGGLNKHILKKAEIDINQDSDMQIYFEPIKTTHQKITGFKMKMSIKQEHLSFYKPSKAISLSPPKKTYIENEFVKQFLIDNKVSLASQEMQSKLTQLVNDFGKKWLNSYLEYLIKYVHFESKKSSIKNIAGFFIKLIIKDTFLDIYQVTYSQNNQLERDIKKQEEEELLDEIDKAYNQYILDEFKIYMNFNYDKYINNVIKYLKESSNTYIRHKILKNTDKNTIIDSPTILCLLLKDLRLLDMDFEVISFDNWKEKKLTV